MKHELRNVSAVTAQSLQKQVDEWRERGEKDDIDEQNHWTENKIHVFARVRPILPDENLGTVKDRGGVPINEYECVSVKAKQVVLHEEIRAIGGASTGFLEHKNYRFDHVFSGTSNDEIFAKTVAPLLESSTTSAVIMFGQTNSGKTYTAVGIAEQCVNKLRYPLKISCFEVAAREMVRDLLISPPVPCVLRDDGQGGLLVVGASEAVANCPDEALRLVRVAAERRATRATRANQQSSRSHAVLCFRWDDHHSISIVDLAGSERRQEALFDDTDALEETKAINTALSVLKDCIRAISRKDTHIPFRRSALTRLLRSALDPQQSTVSTTFIAHLAPTNLSILHTKNTLDYCMKMTDIASDTDRRKAHLGPERWTATRLCQWIFETFKNEEENIDALAQAFASISGKQMATIWRGELVRRVEAAGFSELTADKVYDAFHDLNRRFKKKTSVTTRRGGRGSSLALREKRGGSLHSAPPSTLSIIPPLSSSFHDDVLVIHNDKIDKKGCTEDDVVIPSL